MSGKGPGVSNPAVGRVDPRAKIIVAAALSIITLRADAWLLASVSVALCAFAVWARPAPRLLLRSLRPALPFIALVFLLHLFSHEGRALFSLALGAARLTHEGLAEGALLAWKFTLLVAAGSLLTLTTPASELALGMERLLRPARLVGVSSQDLALMLSLALRFIPTITAETAGLKEAQAARGASFDTGGPLRRLRALAALAVPLCLAVFRRCDELVAAMEARGYDGGARTCLRDLALTASDRLVIVGAVGAVGAAFLY